MTTDEWIAACLADAPPLSEAQIAILRPIFGPALARTAATARPPRGLRDASAEVLGGTR